MTTRERFNQIMHWQRSDQVPNMDFGYWIETIKLWHKQGLPADIQTNQDMENYLGLEGVSVIPAIPVINGLYPLFEYKVLEQNNQYKIIQDSEGNICKVSISGTSFPKYLKYGLETYQDWERYKLEHLDYTNNDRIGDVKGAVEKAHSEGMAIGFNAGSLYGCLRNWMGVENISIALMTERRWVAEMMDHLMEMAIYLIEKALPDIDVDMAWWWEDMCYNKGPLISPELFNELMVPRYKQITDALLKKNIDINILDCDGRIYELVPGWLNSGINCMFPIEAAHTDPIKLRQDYGKDILLIGGVNKLSLINSKENIDRELERLQPLIEQGGYIPTIDHRVPADVSFENYLYYLEKKKALLMAI